MSAGGLQETDCTCLFFFFSFLDLYVLFGKHLVWIKCFLFSFFLIFPLMFYTSWPSFVYMQGDFFQLDLWGSVLPFYKEKDKIKKGRREDKAPINSSWVNRQTGAAEQRSPLKKTHIFFWWHLIILFKISQL